MAVYLDNSATTKPCPEAVAAVHSMLTENYGNPSSLHGLGIDAAKAVIAARQAIADRLGCEREEIYFTSGATEANNLAILGAARAMKRRGNKIVSTAIEHESVMQALDELEKQGFEVVRLMPDSRGNISASDLRESIDEKTVLVSMMYINNEVGSVLPVDKIRKIVTLKKSPALVHIDCVQAFGKVDVRPQKLGADLISVTAHKIHGAKGCGALYVKKGTIIHPRTFGGEQEKRLRPGTEAAELIAGFGAAVEALPDLAEQGKYIAELNAYARQRLSALSGVIINSAEDASPFIINAYIPTFMRSQTVLQWLYSNHGICVSNGSACAKGKKSHVLSAMKLSDEIIDKSIRISFSRESTRQDVDALISALEELLEKYPK